jgi:hypothetical protein
VMAKARARITAIFVMAMSPLQRCEDCQNRARTSVTAITFWSFVLPIRAEDLFFGDMGAPPTFSAGRASGSTAKTASSGYPPILITPV